MQLVSLIGPHSLKRTMYLCHEIKEKDSFVNLGERELEIFYCNNSTTTNNNDVYCPR